MNEKSSTGLAILSILCIVVVLFIAISNVETAPVRRPFPTQGADFSSEVESEKETVSQPAFKSVEPIKIGDQFEQNFSSFVESVEQNPSNGLATEATPDSENTVEWNTNKEDLPGWQDDSTENTVTSGVNSQLLSKAGFSNFIIKPRPFSGELFDRFDLQMLSYLNVIDKKIIQIIEGREIEVLRIYEFNFEDEDGAKEIYDYLKADLKGELGTSINETNQFGMSSFFINFQPPRDSAFLVVKTKTNVYALSYPKSKEGEEDYFKKVSSLLSELI